MPGDSVRENLEHAIFGGKECQYGDKGPKLCLALARSRMGMEAQSCNTVQGVNIDVTSVQNSLSPNIEEEPPEHHLGLLVLRIKFFAGYRLQDAILVARWLHWKNTRSGPDQVLVCV